MAVYISVQLAATGAVKMTQAIPTNVIDNLRVTESDEDIVVTDVTRPRGSAGEKQQYEKWKQQLRIELIREHLEAQKKNNTERKPVLLQMLNLTQNQ